MSAPVELSSCAGGEAEMAVGSESHQLGGGQCICYASQYTAFFPGGQVFAMLLTVVKSL